MSHSVDCPASDPKLTVCTCSTASGKERQVNTEYTPTTEEVRHALLMGSAAGIEALEQFDRWFQPYADALAAIQRVRGLHIETNMGGCSDPEHCSPFDSEPICGSCLVEWPCPTITALEGSSEVHD